MNLKSKLNPKRCQTVSVFYHINRLILYFIKRYLIMKKVMDLIKVLVKVTF